jgi:hypothetical protein
MSDIETRSSGWLQTEPREGARGDTLSVPTRRDVTLVAQAYRILQGAFIAAPTIAGLDKFFHLLTNWDQYLAPQLASLLPMPAPTFMGVVGVVEIAAGLLVAVKPRLGAYVVAAWLGGIILNLLILGRFFDVALRDFGLMLGALALARLASSSGRSAPGTRTQDAAA